MRRLTLMYVSLLLASILASAQRIDVGTASAGPGQRATGNIEVPAGVDAAARIPVIVIRGERPGPVLALVAGAHGTEYASIIALEQLGLMPAHGGLSGTLIIVPLVNVASFEQKVPHVNPVDGKNMNRFYPGNPNGTQTERAAWAITKEVVEKADYLIDLHGGDLDESLRPYSYWAPTGKVKQDAISREMALAFGLDTIIISNDHPTELSAAKYLETNASLRGKPSITVEAGYAGTVEREDVEALVTGCISVMRYLKMMNQPSDANRVENPLWIERIESVNSNTTEIFYPLVKRGTYVQRGMKIGYVTDYFGGRVMDARSPEMGVVLYICAVPSMKKGDTIANIGVVAAKAP